MTKLSSKLAISAIAVLAAFFYTAFAFDAGNYYHGGSPGWHIAMNAAAVLTFYALVELYRTNSSVVTKACTTVAVLPVCTFAIYALITAMRYVADWIG